MNSKELIAWLGFANPPDFSKSKLLGSFLGFGLFVLSIGYVCLCIFLFFDIYRAGMKFGPYSDQVNSTAIRNVGLVFAALLGAPFLIWRTLLAAKQTRLSEESLFNEKLREAAVGLLAQQETTERVEYSDSSTVLRELSEDLVARVAAIERLEALAEENPQSSPRVARLLAAYVRGNFPTIESTPSTNIDIVPVPRSDLQAAISAIGRVLESAQSNDSRKWRLDLKACDLTGVSFNGSFRAVDFSQSKIECSIFRNANCEGAYFTRASLNYSRFISSALIGAKMFNVTLNRPETNNNALYSPFVGCDLKGLVVAGADISAVPFLPTNEIANLFGSQDTVVSRNLQLAKPDERDHSIAHGMNLSESGNIPEDEELLDRVRRTGFLHWMPYEVNNGAMGWCMEKFYDSVGLKGFPYL
jgi:uncharacterized protein YjbI with pentapeptide repeats